MKIEQGLFYSEEHEWVRIEGNQAFIGITDFAQESMGDIVFVELPDSNENYEWSLYNNLGQQILQSKTVQAGKNELSVSALPKGHYWLTISAGTQTYSQAVIVQ